MVVRLNIDAGDVVNICPRMGYEYDVVLNPDIRRDAIRDTLALYLLHIGGLGRRNDSSKLYYDVRTAMIERACEAPTRAEQTVRTAMYTRTDVGSYFERHVPIDVSNTARRFVRVVDDLSSNGCRYPESARIALGRLVRITYPTIVPAGIFTALEKGVSQEILTVRKNRRAILTTVFLHALIGVYKPSEGNVLRWLESGLVVRIGSDGNLNNYVESLMQSSAREGYRRRLREIEFIAIARDVVPTLKVEMSLPSDRFSYGISALAKLPVYLEIPDVKK